MKIQSIARSAATAAVLAVVVSASSGCAMKNDSAAESTAESVSNGQFIGTALVQASGQGLDEPATDVAPVAGNAIPMSLEAAKEAFGISYRNGTDSVDAFVTYLDIATGTVWVPAFQDNPELLVQIQQQELPLTTTRPELKATPIAVRISDYTQQQVESAVEQTLQMLGKNTSGVTFMFNPIVDGIEAIGDEMGMELLGSSVNGVRIAYTVTDDAPVRLAQ